MKKQTKKKEKVYWAIVHKKHTDKILCAYPELWLAESGLETYSCSNQCSIIKVHITPSTH